MCFLLDTLAERDPARAISIPEIIGKCWILVGISMFFGCCVFSEHGLFFRSNMLYINTKGIPEIWEGTKNFLVTFRVLIQQPLMRSCFWWILWVPKIDLTEDASPGRQVASEDSLRDSPRGSNTGMGSPIGIPLAGDDCILGGKIPESAGGKGNQLEDFLDDICQMSFNYQFWGYQTMQNVW